jgi:large subunit ribosomal protein L35
MRKLKTNKAANKRFTVTKTGKIMRGHQMNSHLKTKKSAATIRRHVEPAQVSDSQKKTVERLLPYGTR